MIQIVKVKRPTATTINARAWSYDPDFVIETQEVGELLNTSKGVAVFLGGVKATIPNKILGSDFMGKTFDINGVIVTFDMDDDGVDKEWTELVVEGESNITLYKDGKGRLGGFTDKGDLFYAVEQAA